MIGDLILWLKSAWKEQTCIHKYEWIYRHDTGGSFEMCAKCERIRE
jgi:hypothetical protein